MAAFPSLSKGPILPLDESPIDDQIITPAEGGYPISALRYGRERIMIKIKYRLLSVADTATMQTFWSTTTARGTRVFTYTHPITGASHNMRIMKGSFRNPFPKGVGAQNRRSYSFTLIEV